MIYKLCTFVGNNINCENRIFTYMKNCIFLFSLFLFFSCSMKKKIINELYLYEKLQFQNSEKPKNIRAMKKWKENHNFIFNNFKLCDSFVLIEWFDSYRLKAFDKMETDYYCTSLWMNGDTGYVCNFNNIIEFKKQSYYLNPLNVNIYDSLFKKQKMTITTMSYYGEPIRIIQFITIRKRKVKIVGFNLNSIYQVSKKI